MYYQISSELEMKVQSTSLRHVLSGSQLKLSIIWRLEDKEICEVMQCLVCSSDIFLIGGICLEIVVSLTWGYPCAISL